MNDHDIDDLLRRLDPAQSVDIPSPSSLQGERIRREALDRAGATGRRSRRGLVAAIAALAVLAAAAAVGAAIWLSSSPETDVMLCLDAADLDAARVVVEPEGTMDLSDCNRVWQNGTFGDGTFIPTLIGCISDGGVVVVPGDESTCAELGLPVAVDLDTVDPVIELRGQLVALIPVRGCAPFDATVDRVEELVAASSLSEWPVLVTTQPSEERPCASISLDPSVPAVVVVPIPDTSGG